MTEHNKSIFKAARQDFLFFVFTSDSYTLRQEAPLQPIAKALVISWLFESV